MATSNPLARFLELILTPSPVIFALGLVVIVLVPILAHFLLVQSSQYTTLPSVFVVGPSHAGKTALVTRFERGPAIGPAASRTSTTPLVVELSASAGESDGHILEETSSSADADCTKFFLVDLPGHGKLRAQVLSRLEPTAIQQHKVKAVVFMVDSATLLEEQTLRESGEYLHVVLLALQRAVQSGSSRNQNALRVPVLVAANKLDLFAALPPSAVQTALEAELSRIRNSRGKSLLDSGIGEETQSEGQDSWLGEYGSKSFTFAQMEEFGIEVNVLGGSTTPDPGTEKWWKWIAERVTMHKRV